MPPCAGMIRIRFDGRSFDQLPLSPATGLPCSSTSVVRRYAGAMSVTAPARNDASTASVASRTCRCAAPDRHLLRDHVHDLHRDLVHRRHAADPRHRLLAAERHFLVDSNYWYAHDADPLFMHPPVWMRIVTGLSAFVYLAFYLVLVPSLIRGWNWIQLPAVIYATMIASHHRHHRVRRRVLRRARVPDPEPGEVPGVQPAVRADPAAAADPDAQAAAVHAEVLS